MAEEYKNFNDYEKPAEEVKAEAPAEEIKAEEPDAETAVTAEPAVSETAAPDPNPPTGWAPGYSEGTAPAVSKSSPMGITSIILSFAGYCTYGIASIVGIFLGAKAYKRNKSDVAAKIGLTACLLMTLYWVALIAFYIFTPTGQEMLQEIIQTSQDMMEEMYSSTDIYSMFK